MAVTLLRGVIRLVFSTQMPARQGGVQHCRYFRLHRDGPIAVARREAAREVLFLPRGPLPQLGFGGIRRLLRQGGTQCVRRHGGGNIPHPGPADLCIHAGAQT